MESSENVSHVSSPITHLVQVFLLAWNQKVFLEWEN